MGSSLLIVRATSSFAAEQARQGNLKPALKEIAEKYGLGPFERSGGSGRSEFKHGTVIWKPGDSQGTLRTNLPQLTVSASGYAVDQAGRGNLGTALNEIARTYDLGIFERNIFRGGEFQRGSVTWKPDTYEFIVRFKD